MQDRIIDLKIYKAISGESNSLERIKAPIFLDVVLAIEIMQELLSNLEEKGNPSILKDE